MPLSIKIKFKNTEPSDLENIKKIFYKINIVKDYELEEFNIENSFFKIYYYGNPKRLKDEFLKFGYRLENDRGLWVLYK